MKEFGKQLDLYLFMHKISVLSFSKDSGVGKSTIARIINGQIEALQQPTKDKFSKYFDMPFDEIESNPSIINKEAARSFFKGLDLFKRKTKVINLLSYSQYLNKDYNDIDTIPVTSDTDEKCFALIVENSDFITISDGDIIIVNPENIDISQLNSKTILLKSLNEPCKLLIRKVIIIDNDIFIKGQKAEPYSPNDYMLVGWVTEIRYKR